MTHIDEGRLQALIDGELRLDERHRAERHLADCAPCRAELAALRGSVAHFGAAMAALDGWGWSPRLRPSPWSCRWPWRSPR